MTTPTNAFERMILERIEALEVIEHEKTFGRWICDACGAPERDGCLCIWQHRAEKAERERDEARADIDAEQRTWQACHSDRMRLERDLQLMRGNYEAALNGMDDAINGMNTARTDAERLRRALDRIETSGEWVPPLVKKWAATALKRAS